MDMTEHKKIRILNEFRTQLINFLDEIIEQFPLETDFVLIRLFLKDLPATDIIGRFIRDLLPLKNEVDKRNESFFLENTILYTGGQVQTSKIDHIKSLWTSNKLDANDKKVIWDWMDLFMKLADTYHKSFGYIKTWEPITV